MKIKNYLNGKKTIASFLLITGILFVVAVPFASASHSPGWWPIVQCGLTDNAIQNNPSLSSHQEFTQTCTTCDLFKLAKNITDFIAFALVPAIGALLFVTGGLMILFGGARPSLYQTGKNIFFTTFVGVLIIYGSWIMVNAFLKTFAPNDVAQQWWKIKCTAKTPSAPVPPTPQFSVECIEDPPTISAPDTKLTFTAKVSNAPAGTTFIYGWDPILPKDCDPIPDEPWESGSASTSNSCEAKDETHGYTTAITVQATFPDGTVQTAQDTCVVRPSTACIKGALPIGTSTIKRFNNTIHGRPGSGHGWVKCGDPLCAVDLSVGMTATESCSVAKNGAMVRSPIDGRITEVSSLGSVGEFMVITNNGKPCSVADYCVVLAHVDPLFTAGTSVSMGQIVGQVTSYCNNQRDGPCSKCSGFGPHLHFEIKWNGQWISAPGNREATWLAQQDAILNCRI